MTEKHLSFTLTISDKTETFSFTERRTKLSNFIGNLMTNDKEEQIKEWITSTLKKLKIFLVKLQCQLIHFKQVQKIL